MDELEKIVDDCVKDIPEQFKPLVKTLTMMGITTVIMGFMLDSLVETKPEKPLKGIAIKTPKTFLYYRSPKEYIMIKKCPTKQ